MDLFNPIEICTTATDYDHVTESLSYELTPLFAIHDLHTLTLTGMPRSCQTQIWQIVWQNPNLSTLTLEMALEPVMLPPTNDDLPSWRKIDSTWKPNQSNQAVDLPFYLGAHGTGVLHDEFGDGEYLDTLAISAAKKLAAPNIPFLPLRRLILLGFAVDSLPFMAGDFDPSKFTHLTFKENCLDAGFSLPEHMKKRVSVSYVGAGRECKAVKAGCGEVRVVDVRSKHTEDEGENTNLGGQTSGLRKKLSAILPRAMGRGTRDVKLAQ